MRFAALYASYEAVEKPLFEKHAKRVRNLASQNRLHATISLSGMVNVPPYLHLSAR